MVMARQAAIDIHDFRGRLAAAERRLHNPLSERNRGLILEFERKLMSEGLSAVRVEKHVETLKKIAEMLGKDFDAATKDDIEDLVLKIERGTYSPWNMSFIHQIKKWSFFQMNYCKENLLSAKV
ncbi:MAG: hypothetical protein LZ158_04050 [Thaumarchaeota archaeon]|jgi:hypothetical protein|nr:hypothetical protein [Candidatus Terraquivivens yellowstonensis]